MILGAETLATRRTLAGLHVLPVLLPAPGIAPGRASTWPPNMSPSDALVFLGETAVFRSHVSPQFALLGSLNPTGIIGDDAHQLYCHPGQTAKGKHVWWHALDNLVMPFAGRVQIPFGQLPDIAMDGWPLTPLDVVAEDMSRWPIKCGLCGGPAYQGGGAVECKNRCRP